MLKTPLLHPEILRALGRCGHGSRILIADGNYPCSTRLGANATLVNLNLTPGIVSCTDVLQALLAAVPVEHAAVMAYATTGAYALDGDPPIWAEFRRLLTGAGYGEQLEPIERFAFYDSAGASDVALTVATADQRIYANLLLTVGVVMPN